MWPECTITNRNTQTKNKGQKTVSEESRNDSPENGTNTDTWKKKALHDDNRWKEKGVGGKQAIRTKRPYRRALYSKDSRERERAIQTTADEEWNEAKQTYYGYILTSDKGNLEAKKALPMMRMTPVTMRFDYDYSDWVSFEVCRLYVVLWVVVVIVDDGKRIQWIEIQVFITQRSKVRVRVRRVVCGCV